MSPDTVALRCTFGIGGLKGRQGAVYNSHTPGVAKEKGDQLRADADRAGARGVVTFKVELNNTSRETSLTPADARRVARAIEEARVLLGNQDPPIGPRRRPRRPCSHSPRNYCWMWPI